MVEGGVAHGLVDKGCRVMLLGKYPLFIDFPFASSRTRPNSTLLHLSNPILTITRRPLGPRLLRLPPQRPPRHPPLHHRHPPSPNNLAPPLDRLLHLRPGRLLPWRRHHRLIHLTLPNPRLQPDSARARRPPPSASHQSHEQIPILDGAGT